MSNAKVIQVGNLYPDTPNFKNKTSGRVYSTEGISPTLTACQGGGRREPKIVVYEQQDNNTPQHR